MSRKKIVLGVCRKDQDLSTVVMFLLVLLILLSLFNVSIYLQANKDALISTASTKEKSLHGEVSLRIIAPPQQEGSLDGEHDG